MQPPCFCQLNLVSYPGLCSLSAFSFILYPGFSTVTPVLLIQICLMLFSQRSQADVRGTHSHGLLSDLCSIRTFGLNHHKDGLSCACYPQYLSVLRVPLVCNSFHISKNKLTFLRLMTQLLITQVGFEIKHFIWNESLWNSLYYAVQWHPRKLSCPLALIQPSRINILHLICTLKKFPKSPHFSKYLMIFKIMYIMTQLVADAEGELQTCWNWRK